MTETKFLKRTLRQEWNLWRLLIGFQIVLWSSRIMPMPYREGFLDALIAWLVPLNNQIKEMRNDNRI